MSQKKVTYHEAIVQAIREEMLRDEAVCLVGEDMQEGLPDLGSVLRAEFGPVRVIDTPMAEAAIIGSVMGAALMGMRPITEMSLIDLLANGFEQMLHITMQMGHDMERVPLVIRGSVGSVKKTATTSTLWEASLYQMPGMKVVAPSTLYDAKGMLKAAIRDDHPVVYLESQALRQMSELSDVWPSDDYTVPLDKAIVRREGQDMTIATYGAMIYPCLRIAQILEEDDDLAVEILDLRCLSPLDYQSIFASVKRTNKMLLVYEDSFATRISTELSALIVEELDDYLEGPVTSVSATTAFDASWIPASLYTSTSFTGLACTERILSVARELAAY